MVVNKTYSEEIALWQHSMEERLRADGGWLSLVGLDWLEEGRNTIGSASDKQIVLPDPAPATLGYIDFAHEEATIIIETDARVTIDDLPVKSAVLRPDSDENGASKVKIGSISFHLIKRSNQYGLRISDSKSPALANFEGRKWFPIDSIYKVPATFVPHDRPRTIQVDNSLGMVVPMENPGYLEFELHGKTLRLEAFEAGESQWWIIFKDRTSGHSTYGAGRFMYVQRPNDAQVWIDFNRAYHPPCVFTDYATCPLAPKENVLPVEINAGERF